MIDKTKINEYTASSGESPSDRLTRSQLKELGGHVWQLYEGCGARMATSFLPEVISSPWIMTILIFMRLSLILG